MIQRRDVLRRHRAEPHHKPKDCAPDVKGAGPVQGEYIQQNGVGEIGSVLNMCELP